MVKTKKRVSCHRKGKNVGSFRAEYYALPLSPLANESIALAQKDISGTETEICVKKLPDYPEKQEVYRVSEVLAERLFRAEAHGKCKLYWNKGFAGKLVPYHGKESLR